MNDITKIKVDGEPESSYQLYPRNNEFAQRAKCDGGGTGGSSVQTDWNQNDSSQPDYLKNRPFGEETETTVILESQKIDFSQSFKIPSLIVVGNTYHITWDGTDYTIVATTKEIIAGEISVPYLEQADGLFSITSDTMKASDNGIHTVAIYLVNSSIKTIDEKFIPDSLKNKMSSENPIGTGAVSFNRKNDTTIGDHSFTEGFQTTASAPYSHAEGSNTTASGNCSHAEGYNTRAYGYYSHAEGKGTIAFHDGTHVEGKYNYVNYDDSDHKYAHVVGNGTDDNNRSNAYLLDWSGNAWYAGNIMASALILKSTTENSTKIFKVTVDDSGALTVTETNDYRS